MVNLTRIYTRTGDGGQTRLGDMSLTTKNDSRLEAYATVDEADHLSSLEVHKRRHPRLHASPGAGVEVAEPPLGPDPRSSIPRNPGRTDWSNRPLGGEVFVPIR